MSSVEISLHAASAADVATEVRAFDRPALAPFAALLDSERVHRIAAGTEFCENLIAPPETILAISDRAAALGLPFTYLTPYASDTGLARLRPVLAALAQRGGCEVVFNDWGVLRVLRREFPPLEPVLGRLLNKSLRDPRITGQLAETQHDLLAARSLRATNLDSSAYVDMLIASGVRRVEMDNLPQGLDLSTVDNRFRVSVHAPFGFIATGRSCMAAGLGYDDTEKFAHGLPCRHECQSHQVVFDYTNSPFENRDQQFLLKGNTYFFEHTPLMTERLLTQQARIDRLALALRLPMYA